MVPWAIVVTLLFPKSEFFDTVNGVVTVAILIFSALIAFVEIKLKIWPVAEGKNPNILEKIVLFVNSMLANLASGFKSGKDSVGGADSSSAIVDSFKKDRHIVGDASKLEGDSYYKHLQFEIRKREDNIAELKVKIDDAQRYIERYYDVRDDHMMGIANLWKETKSKLEIEVRQIEKEMHELILQKRQVEERAKN